MAKDSAELAQLKRTCKEDLQFLCKNVLGMKDWDDALHGDLVRELSLPDNHKLLLIPRGHLKSSIVTVGWTIQQLLINPNIRIYITNAVWDLSRTFLREISGLLTDKSLLPDIFGKFNGKGSRFTEDAITIAQRTLGTIKEPTITTGGVEKAVTGMHFDVIIHDDLVEENNVGTPEQIKKIIRFRQNCLDLLDPGGIEVIIGCLVGDSMVSMADGTFKPIKDVCVGEQVWSVTTDGKLVKKSVLANIKQPIASVVAVQTEHNKVECTPEHPFLTITSDKLEWKQAKDLTPQDFIVTLKALSHTDSCKRLYSTGPVLQNEDMWFLGFLYGDGWRTKAKRTDILCVAKGIYSELNEKVKQAYYRWFGKHPKETKFGYYRLDSRKVNIICKYLGFQGNAYSKRVPSWVFKLQPGMKRQFVLGFFDADGHELKGNSLSAEIVNKELLQDIRLLAMSCGMRPTNIHERTRTIQAPHSKKPVTSTFYRLNITDMPINYIYNKVKIKRQSQTIDNTLKSERVVSVIEKKIAVPTYDLTVDDTESFIADGCVVHNTRWAEGDLYGHLIENEMTSLNGQTVLPENRAKWRELLAS